MDVETFATIDKLLENKIINPTHPKNALHHVILRYMFTVNESFEVDQSIFNSDYIRFTPQSLNIVDTTKLKFLLIFHGRTVKFLRTIFHWFRF